MVDGQQSRHIFHWSLGRQQYLVLSHSWFADLNLMRRPNLLQRSTTFGAISLFWLLHVFILFIFNYFYIQGSTKPKCFGYVRWIIVSSTYVRVCTNTGFIFDSSLHLHRLFAVGLSFICDLESQLFTHNIILLSLAIVINLYVQFKNFK